jgi:class 3 adenylate cyclase
MWDTALPGGVRARRYRVPTVMESKTIAFVDCCGYSAYTDEHGDAAGVEVYLGMRRAIERAAAGAGVVIVKWTGDGAMLAADSSTAALTCIYRAMIAMRESSPLALRAGATIGPVTRVPYGELDYLGSAVNRAARLCARAAPWQVRVGGDADHAAMYFTLRPADIAQAKSAV